MTKLAWDETGKRTYETGVDRGVLFVNKAGSYQTGVAWNGLISVNESPTGAEASPIYADNIKYLELTSAEEFGATVEAYTYPDEFADCDGSAQPQPGVYLGQQARSSFALAYRTKLGNDVEGDEHGYKLHIIYGCKAAPSEKSYQTVNDSPEAITFSWELTTTPINVTGYKPTSCITIDSTKVDAGKLEELEKKLYGDEMGESTLPMPDEIIAMFTEE